MDRLPVEILMNVLMFCQPHYQSDPELLWIWPVYMYESKQNWFDPHQKECCSDKLCHHSKYFAPGGYHITMHCCPVKRIPLLLIFGQVCRKFRTVCLLHPFWKTGSWHYLLPFQSIPRGPAYLENWIPMNSHILQRNSRMIHLDLTRFQLDISLEKLRSLFAPIADPRQVHTLVLMIGWRTLGDPEVTKWMCNTYPNLQRLYLKGRQSRGVLQGFDNKTVKYMSTKLSKLTHLFLDGFGGGGYSMRGLAHLLRANASLTHLSIGEIRGVDLQTLNDAAPNLQVLTFCLEVIDMSRFNLQAAFAGRFLTVQQLSMHIPKKPLTTGFLRDWQNLCESRSVEFWFDVISDPVIAYGWR